MGVGGERLHEALGLHLVLGVEQAAEDLDLVHTDGREILGHVHHGRQDLVLEEIGDDPVLEIEHLRLEHIALREAVSLDGLLLDGAVGDDAGTIGARCRSAGWRDGFGQQTGRRTSRGDAGAKRRFAILIAGGCGGTVPAGLTIGGVAGGGGVTGQGGAAQIADLAWAGNAGRSRKPANASKPTAFETLSLSDCIILLGARGGRFDPFTFPEPTGFSAKTHEVLLSQKRRSLCRAAANIVGITGSRYQSIRSLDSIEKERIMSAGSAKQDVQVSVGSDLVIARCGRSPSWVQLRIKRAPFHLADRYHRGAMCFVMFPPR
jgi:hypothetical protein